eukprot:9496696-Pyramimonas_sp.AAC.1
MHDQDAVQQPSPSLAVLSTLGKKNSWHRLSRSQRTQLGDIHLQQLVITQERVRRARWYVTWQGPMSSNNKVRPTTRDS